MNTVVALLKQSGELPRSRALEKTLLDRCVAAVHGAAEALTLEEASVFSFASAALRSSAPSSARRLADAAATYFSAHRGACLSGAQLVDRGVLLGLPRFRDALSRRL